MTEQFSVAGRFAAGGAGAAQLLADDASVLLVGGTVTAGGVSGIEETPDR